MKTYYTSADIQRAFDVVGIDDARVKAFFIREENTLGRVDAWRRVLGGSGFYPDEIDSVVSALAFWIDGVRETECAA